MKIAIAGSSGRMGRTLIEAVLASADLKLSAALDVAGSPCLGKDAGEFSGHDVVKARAAGAAYREPKMSPREARAEGGNRSEPARNEAARTAERNDRPAARAENNRAENGVRQTRNNEARNNETRNNQARNNEARNLARNSDAGNRGQKASRENSRSAGSCSISG